ncbi:P-loop NTPase fold protein [Vibrio rhizosphaerae]|uniref:P-loop NTPase fold protein n=1 Tax=Vibrio rhizosphaerae TaxID=398736 RepID=A0ABU4ISF4_9VIBR|nr:P-loop NTPase fold protein [Vibrio rhizosphaerae]MDW6092052.1 P-loop NTPase fold protein [Vibrio rhizosphaerae]
MKQQLIRAQIMSPYIFRKTDTIGNLDAETDSFLNDCFLESDVYKSLVKFDDDNDLVKRIIIGRTGSGKTALLKKLSTDSRIKKYDTIEAESTVFEHIKNNVFISQLMENGVDLRVFYKSLWQHVLLVKVIDLLYPNNDSFLDSFSSFSIVNKKKYNLALAKEYIESYRNNFFNDSIVSEITDKMQHELSSTIGVPVLKMSGKGNSESTEKIQRATSRYVSSELLRKQKELIKIIKEQSLDEKQMRIIISIDDLDKSWLSSSQIRYDFINALMDAFKELFDIKSVKILISIRTDIIMGIYRENLRQEEKDKSLIVPINWNVTEIRKILDYRINYLIKHQYAGKEFVGFSDIFNFEVNGQKVDEYIISRTMLRPRDAIDFVNLCLSEANGNTSLSEDLVLTAEEKFYHSRKQAMIKEWTSFYSHIQDYLDCISFIRTSSFYVDNVSVKDKIQEHLINNSVKNDTEKHTDIALDFDKLMNVWFCIGVIGIKKSATLTIYSSFEKPYLDITDLNKEFSIHPLFFR